ncbi:hypothetical protein BD414DRAFT_174716 [Trametes punicea]|nr:hypothetical protein BD414DRAFT_174716 [Trametes punicea]
MPPRIKRPRSPAPSLDSIPEPPSPHRAKKLKLLASHSIASPFPDFPHPTPTEAAQGETEVMYALRIHAVL